MTIICLLTYSKENSKGKTTLIRFILYALGYQIPATEGIGDFAKFKFVLKIMLLHSKNINKKQVFEIFSRKKVFVWNEF